MRCMAGASAAWGLAGSINEICPLPGSTPVLVHLCALLVLVHGFHMEALDEFSKLGLGHVLVQAGPVLHSQATLITVGDPAGCSAAQQEKSDLCWLVGCCQGS